MTTVVQPSLTVPYFRPSITDSEIASVVQCLRSGWLTTGPKTAEFEHRFATHVGAEHAIAVNSCTAALHLAVESLGLQAGQAVLVPTMTFAATAEIVRYCGAVPVLVDCDAETQLLSLDDAEAKIRLAREGAFSRNEKLEVVGLIPVHVGGLMADMEAVRSFAVRNGLWLVEDAAHAFPAAVRRSPMAPWSVCGGGTSDVSCFSFYANKTITTGEGGMAVTNDPRLAERIRLMSLHGLSKDAWNRYRGSASWDYRIVSIGHKYNLTDIASSIGLHQLPRAESLREQRQSIAEHYLTALADLEQVMLPPNPLDRIHAWHLFALRLRLERLSIGRDEFLAAMRDHGITCSVHWRPLHLHPYYEEHYPWFADRLPVATTVWDTLVSLPIFPDMTDAERGYVVDTVRSVCIRYARHSSTARPKPR